MISNLLRRTFPGTSTWRSGRYNCHISNQPKCSAVVGDKVHEEDIDVSKILIAKTSPSREDSSPLPLPFSSIPGPGGLRKLPYIGTSLMFKPFTQFTHEKLNEVIKQMHNKYGSVIKVRMGKNYIVFTDSAEDAETIFRNDDMYPLRSDIKLVKMYTERNGLPYALGTVSGPQWQEMRTPLNPLISRPQVCLHYLPSQNMVADDFVHRLQTIKFNPEELSDEFFKFATESIGVVCFNRRLGFLNPDLSNSPDRIRLLEAYKTVLHCIFIDALGIEKRYIKTAKDPFYQKFEVCMKFIRKHSMIYVKDVMKELEVRNIDRHNNSEIESANNGIESNLLASLIVGSKLEVDIVLSIIDSLLIAGTDSTARNLAILFYNLSLNPQVQANAAKEVIDLIGTDGPVIPETLSRMNYVKACVKESMRINFPLSNGTQRILSSDVVLGGYSVPKGTSVIMTSSRSSVNSKNFPDPRNFQPERWMRETSSGQRATDKKSSAFACLPFGHGRRGCIGRRFAEMELYVATAKILQKLEIKVDPSYSGLDTIYKPFITPKVPIPFIFTERKK